MTLEEARQDIDKIDNGLRELFLKRMKVSEAIAEIKAASGDEIYKPDREKIVIDRLTADVDEDVKDALEQVFDSFDNNTIAGIALVLGILFILFVFFPIIVILAVVLLINRRRKERLRLAEMAMKNGQQIPEQLLREEAIQNDDDYRRGIRQMFTGVGLAIFLGIVAGSVGFGIGALVFFIGLGKWFIARQAASTGGVSGTYKNDFNNNLNTNDYDKETDAL